MANKTKSTKHKVKAKPTKIKATLKVGGAPHQLRLSKAGEGKAKKVKKVSPKKMEKAKKEKGAHRVKIRIIGIGGGGGTIVSEIAKLVPKADFWVANTDIQALKRTGQHCHSLVFGQELTHGLGTGSDARLGQLAAKQAREKISKLFQGVDLCILISCLGGGTGSGASPVFAQLAKEVGCLTLGIFTLPFHFEGDRKQMVARQSLSRMSPDLSASIIFPNEKIFKLIDPKTDFQASLSAVNSMLASDLKNLIEVIFMPGLINIDFADLRTILREGGQSAFLASATASEASGNRAETVCKELLSHPLNDYDPRGAKNVLFNIASGENISIDEVDYISKAVFELNPRARIVFGVSQNSSLGKSIVVTLLATGSPVTQKLIRGELAKDKKSKAIIKRRKKAKTRKGKSKTGPDLVKTVSDVVKTAPSSEVAVAKEPPGGDRDAPRYPSREPLREQTKKEEPSTKSLPKEVKKEKANGQTKVSVKKVRWKKPAAQKGKVELRGEVGLSFTTPPKILAKKKKTAGAKQEILKRTEIITKHFQKRRAKRNRAELQRKTALDIHKEMESAEQEHIARERKWDIPAFLRRGQL